MPTRYTQERKKGVGPGIIILVAVVVIIVFIAPALLYILVLGFGGSDGLQTPAATYSKSTITNGKKITILSITQTDISWSDITVQVSDGVQYADWATLASYLDYGTASSEDCGPMTLSGITVNLTVTDLVGDGVVSGGDYYVLEADPGFSTSSVYTTYLVFEPTGGQIGTGIAFTG